MKIVELPKKETPEKKSGTNVIELLRNCLEQAENGDITNIVIIGTLQDGNLLQGLANYNSPMIMIGALEYMKLGLIDNIE
jgi:hypothetical protein